MSERARSGHSLTEVLLASALFAVVGLALASLFRTGAQSAARAGEMQMATVLAAKAVDEVLGIAYSVLAKSAGQKISLKVSDLGEHTDEAPPDADALVVDGMIYRASLEVHELRPGLLRLDIGIHWNRSGPEGLPRPMTFAVVRIVADPLRGLGAP